MFGGSRGKRALVSSADRVLSAFVKTAEASGTERLAWSCGQPYSPSHRDAALMFVGWVEFSLIYLISNGLVRLEEVNEVKTKVALAVRRHAPQHLLGDSYLLDAMTNVREAVEEVGGDYVTWTANYHSKVESLVHMNKGAFLGALLRESLAVTQT